MHNVKEYDVTFSELKISDIDVCNELGCSKEQLDGYIQKKIEDLLSEFSNSMFSKFTYKVFPGNIENDSVYIGEVQFCPGKVISSIIKDSTSFAVFVATAGWDFEKRMKTAKESHDFLEEYVLSGIGSCFVEKTGDYMESVLQNEIGDLNHTNRFSPGYCGWNLTEQKKIFQLLGDTPCGIELSSYSLMTPIKSISGIIGIGTNVKRKLYGCAICDMHTCYKRKKRKL